MYCTGPEEQGGGEHHLVDGSCPCAVGRDSLVCVDGLWPLGLQIVRLYVVPSSQFLPRAWVLGGGGGGWEQL